MWQVQVALSHVAFRPSEEQSSLQTIVAVLKMFEEPFAAAAAFSAQLTSLGGSLGGTHLQSMLQSSLELAQGLPSSHCSPDSMIRFPHTGALLMLPLPISWPMHPASNTKPSTKATSMTILIPQ